MSREYEFMYILDDKTSEEEYLRRAEEIGSLIAKTGGTVLKNDLWGRKRLAYDINDSSYGKYTIIRFSTESTKTVSALEHYCKINEDIIRNLIVRVGD